MTRLGYWENVRSLCTLANSSSSCLFMNTSPLVFVGVRPIHDLRKRYCFNFITGMGMPHREWATRGAGYRVQGVGCRVQGGGGVEVAVCERGMRRDFA